MSAVTSSSFSDQQSTESFVQRYFAESTFRWRIAWSLLLLSCLPFLVPYFRTLWRQELYQYFPFVLLSVGYLFYLRWDRVVRAPSGWTRWTPLLLGVFCLLLGGLLHSTWFGAVAFVLIVISGLLSQRSPSGSSLGYLAIPMVMLIRIPQLHAQSLVVRLQANTSILASLCLDLLGVAQDTSGNTIRLPSKTLFVAEACSGIQSAFTMCFLALLIVAWNRRPLIMIPLYVVVALFLAIVANIFRVVMIVLAESWYAYDLSEGFAHDLVGYFSLAVAAGTLMSFDVFSGLLLHPVDAAGGNQGRNPIAVAWNFLLGFKSQDYLETGYSWVNDSSATSVIESPEEEKGKETTRSSAIRSLVPVTIALASAIIILVGFVSGRSDARPITSKEALLFEPPADFLKDRIGVLAIGGHEMVRNGSDPQLGLHADIWQCNTNSIAGQVVMSQPYVGWHELCVCYEVQDWVLDQRYNMEVSRGKPIAVGEFSKGEGAYGYLFFTAIDSDGNVPTPPSYTLFGRLLAPFGPLVTDDYAETSGSAQTIMLQLWTVSDTKLTDAEIGEIGNSIAEIREQASASVVNSPAISAQPIVE